MMGYLLVIAAGLFQGSFMLPMKFTRRWVWENTWLVFAASAYVIWPRIIALLTVPHLTAVFGSTSARSLLLIALFGAGWGLGAVTFGLGVDRPGLALGFTVIMGLTAAVGTLIPMRVLIIITIAEDEMRLARRLYSIGRLDSSIGYEASNHYFYRPLDLAEKVINCQQVIEELRKT